MRPPKRRKPVAKVHRATQELLLEAQSFLAKGDWVAATECCHQILAVASANLPAGALLARIEYQQGQIDQAIARMRDLLQRFPAQSGIWNDLGLMLQGSGRNEQALEAFRRAVALEPSNQRAVCNAIAELIDSDRSEEAIEWIIRFRQTAGNTQSLRWELIDCYKRTQRWQSAGDLLEEWLRETPNEESLYQALASLWRECGDEEKLADVLKRWLERFPGNPVAEHILKCQMGSSERENDSIERASDAYVRHVFDRFAASFDESLADLNYRSPMMTGQALAERIGPPDAATRTMRVLDGGCGTGLCGPYLLPYSSWLTGVDLSQKMLERARAREIYDELIESELTDFLKRSAENPDARWDLFLASDVFNYFGNLSEALTLVHRVLTEKGWIAFSVETQLTPSEQFYEATTTGRYRHSVSHVAELLARIGFESILFEDFELRKQADNQVRGTFFTARRSL